MVYVLVMSSDDDDDVCLAHAFTCLSWFVFCLTTAVVANWRDRQASSDVENLMYVLGVGYTIEFVAAAAGFILHVVSDKSFKPTLQRALMALLIAHGALR